VRHYCIIEGGELVFDAALPVVSTGLTMLLASVLTQPASE